MDALYKGIRRNQTVEARSILNHRCIVADAYYNGSVAQCHRPLYPFDKAELTDAFNFHLSVLASLTLIHLKGNVKGYLPFLLPECANLVGAAKTGFSHSKLITQFLVKIHQTCI